MGDVERRPLQLGILGAANIARAFTSGVAPSTTVKVAAVASRDAAKAESFAGECGIPRFHGSYEALLADPAIDAIYNPLPNSLHAEWSIRAMEAGKHVLCEKPLATSASDARAMFAAAKRLGRHLVEAYPYRAQPQTLKLRELLAAGAIGKVQLIRSSFGITFSDPNNIRLRPDVGGGALLDAGSYAVSLALLAAGERPERVSATARWSETGVDLSTVATLEFPGGALAQISASFATAFHRHALIAGDGGTIETTYLNHPPVGGPPILTVRRGTTNLVAPEIVEVAPGNGFRAEAESFERLLRHGPEQWTGATPAESIDIALTLDAILASARSGAAVRVGA
ncbi:gfo/Idh/MocA family oxidoreductase [Bosea caraganae]|uniref:Gfo/Idh/MocA family oxidoreductase n=1 Tax=Bosea caraganae TaxID=2763117 RepID=A0A370L5J3_9HYPH|nr:Gfo/Idh/MocA family oxidoreductase [Bosea caraganae]RDJ23367.1 gfo/Idh/MocA family oxidoreductase [Bosea caraganae]RDJ24521.1 gfo/Idh/MocA family oxidoreductase [Bosea caraganae]